MINSRSVTPQGCFAFWAGRLKFTIQALSAGAWRSWASKVFDTSLSAKGAALPSRAAPSEKHLHSDTYWAGQKNGREPFLPLGYKNWDSSYVPKHYLTICHTGNPREDTHNVLKDWLWLQCEKNEMWKESGKCTWKQTLALGLRAPKQHSSVKK